MGDLLDIGSELGGQTIDCIAMLFGGAQEPTIRHHDRSRRIIGEAHVQQPSAPRLGGSGDLKHAANDRRELEQGELVGYSKSPVFRPQQRGEHEDSPLRVVMLACVLEDLRVDHAHLYTPRFFEALAQRLRDRKWVNERSSQRLRCLLKLGIMVALRLYVVAHPGFWRNEHARVGAPRFRLVRLFLQFTKGSVESCNPFGD